MSDLSSLSSSPLSSAPSSDSEDSPYHVAKLGDEIRIIEKFDVHNTPATTAEGSLPSSPARKREPSPPHDYIFADHEQIAVLVMFRSRFSDAFPKSLPHLGPQDFERGLVEEVPGELVDAFLCSLLGLVLNRKKFPERNHYGRALEEAIHAEKSQWPKQWHGVSPVAGSKTFASLGPGERLQLLHTLTLWCLTSSDVIQSMLKESFKQQRHDDDLNQPMSVQPWGRDGDRRRYWLVEGQDDTHFRLYRESNPALKSHTWWSVAGDIPELQSVAMTLDDDGTQAARRLADRIRAALPRFEAGEEKRRQRDYRRKRQMLFTRPEPGFSNYEGRTRGKRVKYSYEEGSDSELYADGEGPRRSGRNRDVDEPAGPTITASGRQVKNRVGGLYGESLTRISDSEGLPIEELPGDYSSGVEYEEELEQDSDSYAGEDEAELSDTDSLVGQTLVVTLKYDPGKARFAALSPVRSLPLQQRQSPVMQKSELKAVPELPPAIASSPPAEAKEEDLSSSPSPSPASSTPAQSSPTSSLPQMEQRSIKSFFQRVPSPLSHAEAKPVGADVEMRESGV